MRLEDKVAIATGGSRGIADRLGTEGVKVTVADLIEEHGRVDGGYGAW